MQLEEGSYNNASKSNNDFDLSLLQKLSATSAFSDTSSTLSEDNMNLALKRVELDLKKEVLEGAKQDREQRRKFANRVFILIAIYLGIVLIALFFCGFGMMSLNQSVIITLLSTMTANVIGIFAMVVRYLFYHKD